MQQQSLPLSCFDFIKKWKKSVCCCRGCFPNKSHTFCMQLFVCFFVFIRLFRIALTMRRKVASAVEIFAVKSHLHNAAPEIVISRFAVSVFFFLIITLPGIALLNAAFASAFIRSFCLLLYCTRNLFICKSKMQMG